MDWITPIRKLKSAGSPAEIRTQCCLFCLQLLVYPVTVVSLNYTSTFETLYRKDQSTEIHHIHGTTKSSIVLGVNADESDELDALNTRFQGFKKYFQRVVYQTDNTYMGLIQSLHESKGQANQNICLFVFGHSLDETDKDIITELFDVADKIVVYYYDQNELSRYVTRLTRIYGKQGFDKLRIIRGLGFYPTSMLNKNWHVEDRVLLQCWHAGKFCANPFSLNSQMTEINKQLPSRQTYDNLSTARNKSPCPPQKKKKGR